MFVPHEPPSIVRSTAATDRADQSRNARSSETAEYAFLVGRAIDQETLDKAIALAAQWGVTPHTVLISVGWVSRTMYVSLIAAHLGLAADADRASHDRRDPAGAVQRATLDATLGRPSEVASMARAYNREGRAVTLISDEDFARLETPEIQALRSDQAIAALLRTRPLLSAGTPVWLWQLVVVAIASGLIAGCAGIAPDVAQDILLFGLALAFLPVAIMRALILALVARWPAGQAAPEEIADADLPVYSILVPLFREGAVLPDLVSALSVLDYPAAKLDVLIILEEVDQDTQRVAADLDLPGFMRVIVVPDSLPRTKPKALNYALQHARGSYVVVYDAEDVPDPDQLRRAVSAFRQSGDTVSCLQARLNIHNAADAWLARQFAIEYSVLFDLTLPVLIRLGLPVPLGGTSNHFPGIMQQTHLNWPSTAAA